jgi:hypothetical protein
MIFDSILRKLGCYDSNGLKHSLQHLKEVKVELINKCLECQAEYADKCTVKNVNNHDFIVMTLLQITEQNCGNYLDINATAIGNMAYIALCCKNKHLRDICLQRLQQLKRNYNLKNIKAVHHIQPRLVYTKK